MNKETANLMSLGECDPELEKKIISDIERVVVSYMRRELPKITEAVITQGAYNLERLALRALKNHLNRASDIY